MSEKWMPIDGYPGRAVSDQGRIRKTTAHKIRMLVQRPHYKNSYLSVIIKEDKIKKRLLVHRLVAIAFVDNPQSLPEVNHKDGNKANNKASNLEWISHADNMIHAGKLGLIRSGKDHHNYGHSGRFTNNQKK